MPTRYTFPMKYSIYYNDYHYNDYIIDVLTYLIKIITYIIVLSYIYIVILCNTDSNFNNNSYI